MKNPDFCDVAIERVAKLSRSYASAECAAATRVAMRPAGLGPEGVQPSQVTRDGMVVQVSLEQHAA